MILVVDSNSYRREKLSRYFRYDGLPSMCIGYEDFEMYTKPLVTLLVDPSRDFLLKIKSSLNTHIIVVNKTQRNNDVRTDLRRIYKADGMVSSDEIKEEIKNYYGYDLKTDKINHVMLLDSEKDVIYTLERLYLKEREYKVLKFFLYNVGKVFPIYEIFEYLHFNGRIKEDTFVSYVKCINRKCKREYRERLIYKRTLGYEMVTVTGISTELYNQKHNIFSIQG